MAYEDISLADLMEAVRADRADSQPDLDDFFGEEEVPKSAESIDVDACVKETLQTLEPYRLTEEEQQIIREFLTFRIQTMRASVLQVEARQAYYNLLIHSDEKESIRRFAEILCSALDISPVFAMYTTEKAMIMQQEPKTRPSRPAGNPALIPPSTRFLLINDCKETPRLDLDGNGSARDASRKAIEAYNNMWRTVIAHIKQHPQTVLIVGCSEDVYRSTLRPFNELSQRICSHHIQLTPQTEEDLLGECIMALRGSSFTLSEGFEQLLRKYFYSTYPTSELKGQAFITDLVGQIYARFYCRQREGMVLTGDCIPSYDPLAQSAESVLGQLNDLVGLEAVKTEFQNIYKMRVAGLTDPEHAYYHMLFAGNPGTGKTTVARMAADLFFRMGIIKTNKLVVVKPCDLVSEWIGGTGIKAMEVIRRAYNGVLFIDEAYGIANMDRSDELLNVLLQEMENNGDKLIVIFAGYTDEMRELLKANPGLGSRIAQEIRFDDYTRDELVQIFLQMCKKDGFSLDPSALDELEDCIAALQTREFFGNARDIRNMLQDLKEAWSDDYYAAATKYGADRVNVEKRFMPHHFEKIMPPKKEVSINDLIGLDMLKNKLESFKRQAMYQKYLKEKGFSNLSEFSMHMVFTGNPGTGKTTVAKLIADDLYSVGMLKTNRLVVAERKDLVSAYGDTARKTADVIRKAVGGVLFVDEAYSLAGNRGGGRESIEVFLTAMEEHKADTVFIFAGYVDEMQDFLAMNPGIQSRIGYTFHFEDYSPDELTQMYRDRMHKMGFQVSDAALKKVREVMEYFMDVKNFGNGRFVNHVIHQTISRRADRDFKKQYRNISVQDIPSIKALIETAPNNMQLYDPGKVTAQEQRRIAIHELGHAVTMVGTDPGNVPESISIRSHAGSLGRVTLPGGQLNRTEEQLLNHIATLLGGLNAEKLCLGSHSTGCAGDYARARRIAEDMVRRFAMTTYGASPSQILKAADQLSAETVAKYRKQIESITEMLLQDKELTGKEFVKALGLRQTKKGKKS